MPEYEFRHNWNEYGEGERLHPNRVDQGELPKMIEEGIIRKLSDLEVKLLEERHLHWAKISDLNIVHITDQNNPQVGGGVMCGRYGALLGNNWAHVIKNPKICPKCLEEIMSRQPDDSNQHEIKIRELLKEIVEHLHGTDLEPMELNDCFDMIRQMQKWLA